MNQTIKIVRCILVITTLLLTSACSNTDSYPKDIIGTWEIYSLDGETDLYKTFKGVRHTFNPDGSYTRHKDGEIRISGTYTINDNNIVMKNSLKDHSTQIKIKGNKLSFSGDSGFTRGGVPRKSVYQKIEK